MENVIKVNENLILIYKDGFLCEVEKPLDKVSIHISFSGNKRWFKNGRYYRDNDLPASEYATGTRAWHKNGRTTETMIFQQSNGLTVLVGGTKTENLFVKKKVNIEYILFYN